MLMKLLKREQNKISLSFKKTQPIWSAIGKFIGILINLATLVKLIFGLKVSSLLSP